MDDASTDGTAARVRGIDDPRIRLILRERQGGAGAARNTGIDAARGEIVAFLDSDDEWHPDKLARQLEVMDSHPDIALCCTDYWFSRGGLGRVYRSVKRDRIGVADITFGCGLSPGSTLCARRRVFDEVGGFNEAMPRLEDWDWLLRALGSHDLIVVREALATVHLGSPPKLSQVRPAVRAMKARHGAEIRRVGLAAAARFRSALHHEMAVAYFRDRDYVRTAASLLCSLALWPFRMPGFYLRIFTSALTELRNAPRG